MNISIKLFINVQSQFISSITVIFQKFLPIFGKYLDCTLFEQLYRPILNKF